MSTWADMLEVTLVSVAKSDEPLSAQILRNTSARAVSGKKKPIPCDWFVETNNLRARESAWPHLEAKCPIEDNFISSQVSKQHIFFETGWHGPVDSGHDRTKIQHECAFLVEG